MKKYIYTKDFLALLEGGKFEREEEIRDLLAKKLPGFLKVKKEQVLVEPITTSFDYTLSNRADILIKTEGEFDKVILVIECKLDESVARFNGENYTDATKQLHKYCQDVRSLYGVLLSDKFCAIWKYKYFQYNREPERLKENKIPEINKIMEEMALTSVMDVVAHPKTIKYVYFLFIFAFALGYVANLVAIQFKKITNPLFLLAEFIITVVLVFIFVKDIKK